MLRNVNELRELLLTERKIYLRHQAWARVTSWLPLGPNR